MTSRWRGLAGYWSAPTNLDCSFHDDKASLPSRRASASGSNANTVGYALIGQNGSGMPSRGDMRGRQGKSRSMRWLGTKPAKGTVAQPKMERGMGLVGQGTLPPLNPDQPPSKRRPCQRSMGSPPSGHFHKCTIGGLPPVNIFQNHAGVMQDIAEQAGQGGIPCQTRNTCKTLQSG